MKLTCLTCGTQRKQEESCLEMNQRVERGCEGKCRRETRHIAGLPKDYVHLSAVEMVGPVRRVVRVKKELV